MSDFDKIKPWVNSLDQCGFTGHKAMICYNIDFETVEELVSFFTELEKEIKEFKRLRPSNKVKLIIDPEFVVKGDPKVFG